MFITTAGCDEAVVVVIVLKGIQFRSDTNRTGAEDLFFYYSRLLYCPNQMLAVMVSSNLLAMCPEKTVFLGIGRPEKDVCQLADPR